MFDPVFDEANWYRALRLAECAAWLRSAPLPPSSPSEAPEVPGRQIQAWTKQAPFGEGDWLLRRMALDGLDESSFSRLLSVWISFVPLFPSSGGGRKAAGGVFEPWRR
jgi:hypothetical protein